MEQKICLNCPFAKERELVLLMFVQKLKVINTFINSQFHDLNIRIPILEHVSFLSIKIAMWGEIYKNCKKEVAICEH